MRWEIFALLPVLLVVPQPAPATDGTPTGDAVEPNSLHFKRTGKAVFYLKKNGGFELLTGIPFEELECGRCHPKAGRYADGQPHPQPYRPACADCHDFGRKPSVDSPAVCLSCHTQQRSELAHFQSLPVPKDLTWQDVHMRRGMTCTACHTAEHLHEDAGDQSSMLSPGGTDAKCEGCHRPNTLTGLHHSVHGQRLACASCHIRSVFTCNNCHFDTEVAVKGRFKRAISKDRDFIMLVNRKSSGPNGVDQVYPATFQSVVYQGKTFYAIAPFHSHTVMEEGRPCGACHGGERLAEYDDTGRIVITKWNKQAGNLDTVKGVVPIPKDWKQALQFDFADFAGDITKPGQRDKWVFLKQGADLSQMMDEYAEPLTKEQLESLRLPVVVRQGRDPE